MESKISFNYPQMVREIKSTFECKIHPNTKLNSYCSSCSLNICEKCLRNNSVHIGHQIFYYSKLVLSERHIKYYQTLYLFCKYYLNCIKEIVVELLSDLSDINIKEKKLIIGLKSQLKSAYKFFNKLNSYQMHYTKFVLSTYLNCKKLGYFNFQIIQNVYNIKLNSVRIPDLDDKDIINKVKTMIDFLRCTKDNNNVLKSFDGELPKTVYSYVEYNTLKNPKVNIYSVKPPAIDAYITKGEIYELKDDDVSSDNEQNEKSGENNIKDDEKNKGNENQNDKGKEKENEENNIKEDNASNINNEKNESNNNTNNDNNIINNNSINSEINEDQKNEEKNNIKVKTIIQVEEKKISTSPSPNLIDKKIPKIQVIEESKSKSTPPFQNPPSNPLSKKKKLEPKKESLYSSQKENEEFEEEIRNKFFGDITNQSNNENIKKLIYENLTKTCPEEVEYRDKIQYIYHDKATNKDIICHYFGEFKKGTMKRHGRGLFIWEDGESYLGYWANDKREGEGTNTYANGNTYQGYYKNGKKEGLGVYKWKNGDLYSGNWKNDMKDGKGLYEFANGDVYDGMFKNDKINGNGLYTWANKIGYKGQFKNNTVEKNGILRYTLTKDNDDNIIFKNKENNNSSINKKEDNDEKNEVAETDNKNEK